MSPMEINIAIAEHLGWRKLPVRSPFRSRPLEMVLRWHGPDQVEHSPIPDYCGDLNAIAEAIHTLTDEQMKTWVHELSIVIGAPSLWYLSNTWLAEFAKASALQLSTSFLNFVTAEKEAA